MILTPLLDVIPLNAQRLILSSSFIALCTCAYHLFNLATPNYSEYFILSFLGVCFFISTMTSPSFIIWLFLWSRYSSPLSDCRLGSILYFKDKKNPYLVVVCLLWGLCKHMWVFIILYFPFSLGKCGVFIQIFSLFCK
jgi:hypothetical protein